MSPRTTPAMQTEDRCYQVQRLPRRVLYLPRQVPWLPLENKTDVAKRHACHAKMSTLTGDHPSPPECATKGSPAQ